MALGIGEGGALAPEVGDHILGVSNGGCVCVVKPCPAFVRFAQGCVTSADGGSVAAIYFFPPA